MFYYTKELRVVGFGLLICSSTFLHFKNWLIKVLEKNTRTEFCVLEAYFYGSQLGVIAQPSNWHWNNFLTQPHYIILGIQQSNGNGSY